MGRSLVPLWRLADFTSNRAAFPGAIFARSGGGQAGRPRGGTGRDDGGKPGGTRWWELGGLPWAGRGREGLAKERDE